MPFSSCFGFSLRSGATTLCSEYRYMLLKGIRHPKPKLVTSISAGCHTKCEEKNETFLGLHNNCRQGNMVRNACTTIGDCTWSIAKVDLVRWRWMSGFTKVPTDLILSLVFPTAFTHCSTMQLSIRRRVLKRAWTWAFECAKLTTEWPYSKSDKGTWDTTYNIISFDACKLIVSVFPNLSLWPCAYKYIQQVFIGGSQPNDSVPGAMSLCSVMPNSWP